MQLTRTSENEQLMRDYWLGSLSAPEVESLEDRWLNTDEAAEMLTAARDDLIGDYLSDELSAGEKHLFEKNFLVVPANLRDTAIIKSHRKLIDEKKVREFLAETVSRPAPEAVSFLQKINSLFARRFTQTALLASVVLILFAVFIGYEAVNTGNNPGNETARVNAPENPPAVPEPPDLKKPDASPATNPENANANTAVNKTGTPVTKNSNLSKPTGNSLSNNKNSNTSKPAKNAAPKTRNPASFVATLAFALVGTTRGDASGSLVLNEKTKTVRLQIPVKSQNQPFTEYEGKVTSLTDDKDVYQIKLGNLDKNAPKSVSVEIPARLFKSGDYYFSLSGKPVKDGKPAAEIKLVDTFTFTVKRETK